MQMLAKKVAVRRKAKRKSPRTEDDIRRAHRAMIVAIQVIQAAVNRLAAAIRHRHQVHESFVFFISNTLLQIFFVAVPKLMGNK